MSRLVLLLIPAGVAMQLLAATLPSFADAYATTVYPLVSRAYGLLTGWVPFSVAEVLLVAVVVWLVAVSVRNARRLRRGERGARELLIRFAWSAASWLAVAYALFVIWGLNYQRAPLADYARLDASRSEPAELRALCDDLVADVNAMRAAVREDGGGVMRVGSSRRDALARARLGFEPASRIEPALFRGRAGRAKGLHLLAFPMSILGADGIFLMWTGEPSVNMNLPDPGLPFSACHEVAHQIGWAREDEANFVGYLACASHPDPDFRYAGALAALRYGLSALRRVDPDGAGDLTATLSAGVRRDQEALAAYSRRYRSRVQDAAGATYDAYLKSQGQEAGRASYGKMVDLLLAYRKRGLAPFPTEPGEVEP